MTYVILSFNFLMVITLLAVAYRAHAKLQSYLQNQKMEFKI